MQCGSARPNRDLIGMIDRMGHRGPDDRGYYEDTANGIALAHNRLSIIDLSSAGHQPMFNEDETLALVYNGEIYNFQDLRCQLVAAGHIFKSQTDTEVVLHAYEEWGRNCVKQFYGMFAFALWDSRRQELFLARDPMGIKPLYYWVSTLGEFIFASELKAFLALNDFRAEMNPKAIRQFLEFGFIYDQEMASLQGIRKLPAGRWLTVAADGVRHTESYYSLPVVAQRDGLNLSAQVDALFETMSTVVEEHLVADVPLAILLSGGLDSSTLAALAARRGPTRTLSFGFEDSSVDERHFGRQVSEWIGSEHDEIQLSPRDVYSRVEQDCYYFDDLFGDWGLISTMCLYRKCSERGVKVILVGEGADEIFGGYPWFEELGSANAAGKSLLARVLRLYQCYSSRRYGRELYRFLQIMRDLTGESDGDFFSAIRRFEVCHQLPHQYNMKVDKASMAASVEARVPYLDLRIVREAMQMPENSLLADGMNKHLLRRVAARDGLLPLEISRRPKFGGSIAANWMDESPDFASFARDVILDSSSPTRIFGLENAMTDYFERHRQGYPFPHPLSILQVVAWRLLALNLWARHYLQPAGNRPGPV